MLASVALQLRAQIGDQPGEYQVKAAFLLNFTKFVQWPPGAFPDATAPITICVLGEDPFGPILDQLVEGEEANGRKLAVRRIRRIPAPKSCQVLFIGNNQKDVPALISDLGPGVLTVADRESFLREGGMIGFVTRDRRVRFDINLRAASKASLNVSSRLLGVARSVEN